MRTWVVKVTIHEEVYCSSPEEAMERVMTQRVEDCSYYDEEVEEKDTSDEEYDRHRDWLDMDNKGIVDDHKGEE